MSKQAYVRMSLYYLFFFTTIGVFSPYFNLYLVSRGLDSEQVGLVLAVIPLVGIVVQPLWGMINDRFQRQKTTLFLALLVPSIVLSAYPHLHSLAFYMAGAACLAAFQSVATPVADSMTIQSAGVRHYGKVRLYGSLGYACAVVLAAAFYQRLGVKELTVLYVGAAALAFLGLVIYPKPAVSRVRGEGRSLFAGIARLLHNRRFLLVLCFTWLVTISQAVNSNFFTLYYHALHRPMAWLGAIYAFGAISELPFFFVIGRFIERYGAERVFLLGGGVFFLRWIALCFEPPTWVIILMQLSHGLSFTLTFAAGVSLAAGVSSPDNQVTAQTVYSSVNMGLSVIVGSLVGGLVLGQFGPRAIYVFAAAVCVVGLCAMAWLIRSQASHQVEGVGSP